MRQIISLLFLFTSGAIILSCNSITQKRFEFFYYPAKNVYYDVAHSLYIYSLDGGKSWDSLNAGLNNDPAVLGNRQVIYSPTPQVWTYNEEHLKQYNGRALNITGNDSSASNEGLVAERKTKKTRMPAAGTNGNGKPEKKPGLLKRLFGKKN